jgi:cytochrome bd-type quinol oxidase subunit 2
MIPYKITVANTAAPQASLSFLFWGAGQLVLPVIALYTAAVCWLFRGAPGSQLRQRDCCRSRRWPKVKQWQV